MINAVKKIPNFKYIRFDNCTIKDLVTELLTDMLLFREDANILAAVSYIYGEKRKDLLMHIVQIA